MNINFVQTIINDFKKNSFEKKLIIGKNGYGKSSLLKKLELELKAIENSYVLHIDADFNNNFMYNTFNNDQKIFDSKLASILEKLTDFSENKWTKEQLLKELKEIRDSVNHKYGNDEDFIGIQLNPSKIVNNKKLEFINTLIKYRDNNKSPSGQLFYTFLIYLNQIIKHFSKITFNKHIVLIIDEPEKHCHPTLLIKIVKSLNKISNRITTICVSHSPIFAKFFINDLNNLYVATRYNDELVLINYKNIENRMQKEINQFLDILEDDQFKNPKIPKEQYRYVWGQLKFNNWFANWELNNFFLEALFYDNIIICEGQNDYFFLENLGMNDDYYVFKAWGKIDAILIALIFEKAYRKKIFIFVDKDGPSWSIVNDYIEKRFELNHFFVFDSNANNLEDVLLENRIFNQNFIKNKDDLRQAKNFISLIDIFQNNLESKTHILNYKNWQNFRIRHLAIWKQEIDRYFNEGNN